MNGFVVLLIGLVLLAVQVAAWRTVDDEADDDAHPPEPDVAAGDAVARHIGALNYGTPEHARAARRQLLAIGPSVIDALLDWLHALERRPDAITPHTRLRFEDLLVDFGFAGLLRIRPALHRFGDDHPAWPGLLRVLTRLGRGAVEQLVRDPEPLRRRTLDRIVVAMDDDALCELLASRETWAPRLAHRLDEALLPVLARCAASIDPALLAPVAERLATDFGVASALHAVREGATFSTPLAALLDLPDDQVVGDAALARLAMRRQPADVPADLAAAFDLGPGAAREDLVSAAAGDDPRRAGIALVRLALVDPAAADARLATRVRDGLADGPAGWCALVVRCCAVDTRRAWLADAIRNAGDGAWDGVVALCHAEPWDDLLVPAIEAVARRREPGRAAPLLRLLVAGYAARADAVRALLRADRAEARRGAREVVAWARDAGAVEGVLAGLEAGDDPEDIARTLEHIGAPSAGPLHDLGAPLHPALERVRDLCTALAERPGSDARR